MLKFFENGEDVPFAVEVFDDAPNTFCSDDEGTKVFRVNSDKSLTRISASRAGVCLERRRAISKGGGF